MTRRDFLRQAAFAAAGAASAASVLPGRCDAGVIEPDRIPADTPHHQPQIAIIIDDVGYNVSRVLPFLELGVPLTFSVLPQVPYSRRLAEMIYQEGHEVMLHQPMEPYNPLINPGPGALYLTHTCDEMVRIIEDNIAGIPFAVGVNNHMGSHFTEVQAETREALKIFKDNNFFFIDSFTTSNSIAFETARDLHMTSAFRNIFIDNRSDNSYICSQLHKLKQHALRFGHAIGIGHPRPETVRALEEFLGDAGTEGFAVTYASHIVYI
ncbi:MAG: divergent polysaccharide deacetylase family protein [Deltaproteobacteria bacterium]|nr:divergent polysaccharide deacetylase family protein [Deltaproteobacteria bacterium]